MGLFFREKPAAAAEQAAEEGVDFERLLEKIPDEIRVDIETLRGGILINGGRFAENDEKLMERQLEVLVAAAGNSADKATLEAQLRTHLTN